MVCELWKGFISRLEVQDEGVELFGSTLLVGDFFVKTLAEHGDGSLALIKHGGYISWSHLEFDEVTGLQFHIRQLYQHE